MSQEMTAARLIAAARQARTTLAPLPEHCRPLTPDDGYSVQEVLHGLFADDLGYRRAGYKIGCTTPVMQANLGIDHPCAGGVSDFAVHREQAHLQLADYVQVGVECEIGAVLGRDLAPDGAPYDVDKARDCVASVMAAIEIVDNRYQGGPRIGVPTLIADDFYGAGAVLGEPRTDWRDLDLAALSGRISVDGDERDSGVGADVMGDPMAAVAWFANMKAARGEILNEGAFILTGSLTVVQWIEGPCEIAAEIDGLGSVGVTFG